MDHLVSLHRYPRSSTLVSWLAIYRNEHRLEQQFWGRLRLKCHGTCAENRSGLSAKRTSPFKSAGVSVQATTGSRGVRISGSNAGYAVFRGSVRILATHSIRQFPLHFPSCASLCTITFQLDSKTVNVPWFTGNKSVYLWRLACFHLWVWLTERCNVTS